MGEYHPVESVGAAIAIGFHLLGRQLWVDLLQQAAFVDPQAAVVAVLIRSHVILLVAFMLRDHPEYRIRTIQAGLGFAEHLIPWVADFGQEKPEQRGVIKAMPLMAMHRTAI